MLLILNLKFHKKLFQVNYCKITVYVEYMKHYMY